MAAIYEIHIDGRETNTAHLQYLLSFQFTRFLALGHVAVMSHNVPGYYQVTLDLSDSDCDLLAEKVRQIIIRELSRSYPGARIEAGYQPHLSARNRQDDAAEYAALMNGEADF